MTQLQSKANMEYLDEDRLRNERVIGFMKRGVSGDAPGLTRIGTMQSSMLEKFEGLIDSFNLLLARKNEAWRVYGTSATSPKDSLNDLLKKLASPFEMTMSYNALVKIYRTTGLGEPVRMKMRNDMMKLLPQLQILKDNLFDRIISDMDDSEIAIVALDDDSVMSTERELFLQLSELALFLEIYNIVDFIITNIQSSSLEHIDSDNLKVNMGNVLANQEFANFFRFLKQYDLSDEFKRVRDSDRNAQAIKNLFGDYLINPDVRRADDDANIADLKLPSPMPPGFIPSSSSASSGTPYFQTPYSTSVESSAASSTAPSSSAASTVSSSTVPSSTVSSSTVPSSSVATESSDYGIDDLIDEAKNNVMIIQKSVDYVEREMIKPDSYKSRDDELDILGQFDDFVTMAKGYIGALKAGEDVLIDQVDDEDISDAKKKKKKDEIRKKIKPELDKLQAEKKKLSERINEFIKITSRRKESSSSSSASEASSTSGSGKKWVLKY